MPLSTGSRQASSPRSPRSASACRASSVHRRGSRKGSTHSRRSSATCAPQPRSEEHTSELQSLMRISYAVFCLKKKKTKKSPSKKHTYPHFKLSETHIYRPIQQFT